MENLKSKSEIELIKKANCLISSSQFYHNRQGYNDWKSLCALAEDNKTLSNSLNLLSSFYFFNNKEYLFIPYLQVDAFLDANLKFVLQNIEDKSVIKYIKENFNLQNNFYHLFFNASKNINQQEFNTNLWTYLFISDKFPNFKEQAIRNYIEFYLTRNNRELFSDKIKNALKESELYKHSKSYFEKTTTFNPFKPELERFYAEFDCYKDSLLAEEYPESEYSLYDQILNYSKTNQCNILQSKLEFDNLVFLLLDWLIEESDPELNCLKLFLTSYVNNIKSSTKDFEHMFEVVKYKQIQSSKKEDVNDSSNKLIEEYKNNSNLDQIRITAKTELKLDLEMIKKENPEWEEQIVIGEYLYNMLNLFPIKSDYSGIVMIWSKCVENILKVKVYDKIKDMNIVKLILNNKKDKYFLGTIPYVWNELSNGQFSKTNGKKEILKQLNTKKSEKEFDDLILNIESLRENYRNPSAHGQYLISCSNATDCRKLIFISASIISKLINL